MIKWLWRRIEDAAMLVFLFIVASGCASKLELRAPVVPDSAQAAPQVAPPVDSVSADTFPPLVVNESVLNAWAWLYVYWYETEWGLCLQGEKRGRSVFIRAAPLGFTLSASESSVTFGCPAKDFIGIAHSHQDIINGVGCRQSTDDKRAVAGFRLPWHVVVVVCGPDRFAYVLQSDTTTNHIGLMSPVNRPPRQ